MKELKHTTQYYPIKILFNVFVRACVRIDKGMGTPAIINKDDNTHDNEAEKLDGQKNNVKYREIAQSHI